MVLSFLVVLFLVFAILIRSIMVKQNKFLFKKRSSVVLLVYIYIAFEL